MYKGMNLKKNLFFKKKKLKSSVNNRSYLITGASKEIGTALTRVCLRHKAVETRLKTFTTAIMDSLIIPLQVISFSLDSHRFLHDNFFFSN